MEGSVTKLVVASTCFIAPFCNNSVIMPAIAWGLTLLKDCPYSSIWIPSRTIISTIFWHNL